MRFLIDENVRASVGAWLKEHGHDASSIAEVAPSLKDIAILELAVQEKRILITNDLDFGTLVIHGQHPSRGVILFRLVIETREMVLSRLETLLKLHADALENHFVIVTEAHIRIRPLS